MSDTKAYHFATRYDGRFDLAFLEDNERVRSAGDGTGAIEVLTPKQNVRVEVGEWVVRESNGLLVTTKGLDPNL